MSQQTLRIIVRLVPVDWKKKQNLQYSDTVIHEYVRNVSHPFKTLLRCARHITLSTEQRPEYWYSPAETVSAMSHHQNYHSNDPIPLECDGVC